MVYFFTKLPSMNKILCRFLKRDFFDAILTYSK